MADLVILVPSRGRPGALQALGLAVAQTAKGTVDIFAGIDDDDPADYGSVESTYPVHILMKRGPRLTLSAWTNHLAERALTVARPRYFASLGDDHRPRTPGWDRILIDAIESGPGDGWAYGSDMFHGANLPTSWVVSASIVEALGWVMLPACDHMYVDNAVKFLGDATARIQYRPDVVIEHLHPAAGKATWDDTYLHTNTDVQYERDRVAFEAWLAAPDGLAADADIVNSVRG